MCKDNPILRGVYTVVASYTGWACRNYCPGLYVFTVDCLLQEIGYCFQVVSACFSSSRLTFLSALRLEAYSRVLVTVLSKFLTIKAFNAFRSLGLYMYMHYYVFGVTSLNNCILFNENDEILNKTPGRGGVGLTVQDRP